MPGISFWSSCFSAYRLYVGSAKLFAPKIFSNEAFNSDMVAILPSLKVISVMLRNSILAAISLANLRLIYNLLMPVCIKRL